MVGPSKSALLPGGDLASIFKGSATADPHFGSTICVAFLHFFLHFLHLFCIFFATLAKLLRKRGSDLTPKSGVKPLSLTRAPGLGLCPSSLPRMPPWAQPAAPGAAPSLQLQPPPTQPPRTPSFSDTKRSDPKFWSRCGWTKIGGQRSEPLKFEVKSIKKCDPRFRWLPILGSGRFADVSDPRFLIFSPQNLSQNAQLRFGPKFQLKCEFQLKLACNLLNLHNGIQ